MAKRKKKNRRVLRKLAVLVLAVAAAGITRWYQQQTAISLDEVPPYSGAPYVVINGNVPDFSAEELSAEPFEVYSSLDFLGRCGTACANVGVELMPTEERGDIGSVKPTGWQTAKYDIVDGGYLYNRCHLIGYQLTGENANEQNLITGTRYLNVEGMLPFENLVADYVEETARACASTSLCITCSPASPLTMPRERAPWQRDDCEETVKFRSPPCNTTTCQV